MELSNDIKLLKDLVHALLAKVEALESENAALRAENADLRSRLNLNSKNSHKPPSSDGLSKKLQTFKGAQHYARIQSFTSTLRKHSMNVFLNLINVLDRKSIVFQAG